MHGSICVATLRMDGIASIWNLSDQSNFGIPPSTILQQQQSETCLHPLKERRLKLKISLFRNDKLCREIGILLDAKLCGTQTREGEYLNMSNSTQLPTWRTFLFPIWMSNSFWLEQMLYLIKLNPSEYWLKHSLCSVSDCSHKLLAILKFMEIAVAGYCDIVLTEDQILWKTARSGGR